METGVFGLRLDGKMSPVSGPCRERGNGWRVDPNRASDKFLPPLKRLRLQLGTNTHTNLITASQALSLLVRGVTREGAVFV